MKVTTMLVSAMLVLGLTGVAHAANMFAGPLDATASCQCAIVNVSTSTKTIHVQLLDKNGGLIANLGPEPLDAGHTNRVGSAAGSLTYCKFINAASGSFRAVIICDGVALPAR